MWAAMRVRQWLHFVVLPAATIDRDLVSSPSTAAARIGMGCIVASLALGHAYGLNAIADRMSDRDAVKNPLMGRDVLPANLWGAIGLMGAMALVGAYLVGPVSFVAASISLVAGTIYSIGPRLKAYPVIGTALNAAIFGPLLAVGLPDLHWPASFALRLGSFIVLLMQNQLLHECADDLEDTGASVLTTGRLLGERSVTRVVAAIGVCGALIGFVLAPSSFSAAVNAMAIALVTYVTLRPKTETSRRRIVHRIYSIIAGVAIFMGSLGPGASAMGGAE